MAVVPQILGAYKFYHIFTIFSNCDLFEKFICAIAMKYNLIVLICINLIICKTEHSPIY